MNRSLNPLEKIVLKQIMQEHSANDIAKQLHMNLVEVEQVRKNIYLKLEVKNSIGLAKKAIEMGYK